MITGNRSAYFARQNRQNDEYDDLREELYTRDQDNDEVEHPDRDKNWEDFKRIGEDWYA